MKINNQDYHGLSTAEVNQRISNGKINTVDNKITKSYNCLLYTSPSPRDRTRSRMPSSA